MQQLGLANPTKPAQPSSIGFWKRQFQPRGNSKQRAYDWIFGVVLPTICFVFDPVVFKGGLLGTAFLSNYRPFAYLLCFACILSMTAWLVFGEKLRWLNGFLAGLFFFGGAVSLIVGVVIFPFSLAGLFILIGALGFTPLFTAVIYLRNAFRALDASKMFLVKSVRIYAFAFGVIFTGSLAWTVNSEVINSLKKIETGDAQTIQAEARKLKWIAPLVNFDQLAMIYRRSPNGSESTQAIAAAYRELTGENIEENRWMNWD